MDNGTTMTEHFVKHTGNKIGHATKSGTEETSHLTKVVVKGLAKRVEKTSKKIGEESKDAANK